MFRGLYGVFHGVFHGFKRRYDLIDLFFGTKILVNFIADYTRIKCLNRSRQPCAGFPKSPTDTNSHRRLVGQPAVPSHIGFQ